MKNIFFITFIKKNIHIFRKVFLELLPRSGTYASWNFTMGYLVRFLEKDDSVNLMSKLPMFVLNPTQQFSEYISKSLNLWKVDDKIFESVKDATLLAYSILLDKTYKNIKFDKYGSVENSKKIRREFEEFLDGELERFNESVSCELNLDD